MLGPFSFLFFLAHQSGANRAHQLFIDIAHVRTQLALMILTPPTATLPDAAFGLYLTGTEIVCRIRMRIIKTRTEQGPGRPGTEAMVITCSNVKLVVLSRRDGMSDGCRYKVRV